MVHSFGDMSILSDLSLEVLCLYGEGVPLSLRVADFVGESAKILHEAALFKILLIDNLLNMHNTFCNWRIFISFSLSVSMIFSCCCCYCLWLLSCSISFLSICSSSLMIAKSGLT